MDEARAALGWSRDAFSVLQLGRIVPRKGIETLIEAIALLRDGDTDGVLDVINAAQRHHQPA